MAVTIRNSKQAEQEVASHLHGYLKAMSWDELLTAVGVSGRTTKAEEQRITDAVEKVASRLHKLAGGSKPAS